MRFVLILSLFLCFGGALVVIGRAALSDTNGSVHIDGSSTVYNDFFLGHITELQTQSGVEFDVTYSSSGRGLKALLSGEVDMAMISSDLNGLLTALNKKQTPPVSIKDFRVETVGQSTVLFVKNPVNPLKRLTKQQLVGILSGEITMWSDLGIPDLGEIKLVTEHSTGGMFAVVKEQILEGRAFAEPRIILQNAPQVAKVVSQVPGSIGFISDATPMEARFSVEPILVQDVSTLQRLSFVILQDEKRPHVLKLFQFFATYVVGAQM